MKLVDEVKRRGIVVVDIEGFAHPSRTDSGRVRLRGRLHNLVDHALEVARIPPPSVLLRSDLGDGALLLVDTRVPAVRLLHPLLASLALGLGQGRARHLERLRLRAAVHHGTVLQDRNGFTGADLDHAFRLLNASAARALLTQAPAVSLVAMVSEPVYRAAAACGFPGTDRRRFQAVCVTEKETTARAWVHVPGVGPQPLVRLIGGSPAAEEKAHGNEEDDVHRRELLAYAGTLAGRATLDVLVGERAVSGPDLQVAERVLKRLHGLTESIRADRVHRALWRHARAAGELVHQARDLPVRRGLLAVVAQASALAGRVAAFDLADPGTADRCFREAFRAADASGDGVVGGAVCLRLGDSALYRGSFEEAVEVATAGAELTGQADPSVRVALATTVAQAHARMGEASAALEVLDGAQALVADPAFGSSRWTAMGPARFEGDRGLVAAQLGRLDEAEAALHAAIAARPWEPGDGHSALLAAALAGVLFQRGDAERAAAVASLALPVTTRLGSKGRREQFAPLRPFFARHATEPAVRELAGRLRAS